MTTYHTGNPLGSQDPRDLFDSSENLDSAVNTQSEDTWQDRFGKPRKTWHGIEKQAQIDIDASAAQATALAEGYRDEARDARDDARAAAGAIGPLKFYDTYAQAMGDAANWPTEGLIEIARDETRDGARTRYRPNGSALDFVVNLDQLRLDLLAAGGAERVMVRQAVDAQVRSVADVLTRDLINPRMYGGHWDGVGDDTDAMMKAHTLANSRRVPVSYAGISKFCVQADARIPVHTSVDFCGSRMIILGGVEAAPSFDRFNTVFIISDPDCPLVSVTGPVLASNLVRGSIFPTRGLFDGHGYAKLTCALQVPDRSKAGTMDYSQSFKVNRHSTVSHPLSTNCSAHAASIKVEYRKTSNTQLLLKSISLVEGDWNNQRVFQIERCNTVISGFSLLFNGVGGVYDNVCEIVVVNDASDIRIDGYTTTGRPTNKSVGSYCLAIYGGADILINGMKSITGWGSVGSNNVNGIYFKDCILNRVDAHSSGHNIFVDGGELHDIGIKYGWGGGLIKASNLILYGCSAISTRDDYGGLFYGTLFVIGCASSEAKSISIPVVVDCETNPIGAVIPIQAPNAIVQGISRIGGSQAAVGEIAPIAIKVRQSGDIVYSPSIVSVKGVCSSERWRFSMRLDWMNFSGNTGSNFIVEVLDVSATHGALPTTGVTGYAAFGIQPTSRAAISILCSNVRNIALRCAREDVPIIRMADCAINEVSVPQTAPPRLLISGGELVSPTEGLGVLIVGAPRLSVSRNYTSMQGVTVSPDKRWDLSKVAAMSGVLVESGTEQPILPAGVTQLQALNGWRQWS
ncbi:hypothetical protein [Comamonas sp. F1-6]|uniref:hypothetical protein n=1 Tax=Comamonas sp. F1-6 TaxID=673550 RepID=UPI0031D1B037